MLKEVVGIGNSVLYQKVGDEILLLNMVNQRYVSLDRVGADIWELLMRHGDAETVAKLITSDYNIDEATALRDVESFVSELLAADFLTRVN